MPRSFAEIQKGDILTDYGGYEYEVIEKGTVGRMLQKYKWRQAWSLDDMKELGFNGDEDAVVCHEPSPGFEGYDVIVYLYNEIEVNEPKNGMQIKE